MSFPMSLTGSFFVETDGSPDQYVPAVETAIVNWLTKKRARAVSRTEQGVSFKAGLFRLVWNWNPLVPVSSGNIQALPQETAIQITYELRFTEFLIAVTLMIVLFFGPPVLMAVNLNAFESIGILALSWLWLFGGNYALCASRVTSALRKISQQAVDGNIS